jgi:type I restriction enzyme R subunit
MSLNESIVEDAALEWFGELGYAVGHGAAFAGLRRAKPPLAPVKPAAEWEPERSGDSRRQSFGEVVLVGRLREAIRRLNPANACGNTEEFKFQPEGRRCHEEQTGA